MRPNDRAPPESRPRSEIDKYGKGAPKRTRKPPRTAAIVVTSKKENLTYAEVLKKARDNISLQDLDINSTEIRRAANGGLIIEVLGPDGSIRAMPL